ncbi:right-handed parallel beta-helix repeat-containing protein [Kitasatospora azatica]|uniref:right-handed parallel beta-helix repeat-containing protein n=1 Tax=Kitasatospora azatica TaxID=58347 RepID=UPI001E6482FE|nr:right-handed parallel beta-helix repeat-containing protein [Kitasatospora azatica]
MSPQMSRRTLPRVLTAAVTLLLPSLCSLPAHAAAVRLVHPGESIQHAVDLAAPGDTVEILPGTYHESVQISVSGLTLRGLGAKTVITRQNEPGDQPCAKAGHGICVTGTADHPLTGVTLESLTVANFAKNGISASQTDGMTVRRVLAEDNGEQGISQEKSVRGRFLQNEARRNGQAGIFLANIADGKGGAVDTGGALIFGNRLTDNRIGAVVRRLRNLSVEHNTMTGNCTGIFVVGDDGRPRAGALSVRHNRVDDNNTYCPPNGRLPFLQGSGIVLTGVESTQVTDNHVTGNVGASPMSGGIVLFRSFVGGPSTDNTIGDNLVTGNQPADLADRDSGQNTFTGNQCTTSEPVGRC